MKIGSESSDTLRVMPLIIEECKQEIAEEDIKDNEKNDTEKNDTETTKLTNNISIQLPSEVIENYLNKIGIRSSPDMKSSDSDSDSDDDVNPFIADMRRTQNKKNAKSFIQQIQKGTTSDGSMIHRSLTMRPAEDVQVVTKRKSITKWLCCSIL
jgi:hypothetical protein